MLVRNKYVLKTTVRKDIGKFKSLTGERCPEYCYARIGTLNAVANERHKGSPKRARSGACVCEFCEHQTRFSCTAQIVCVPLYVCTCARTCICACDTRSLLTLH